MPFPLSAKKQPLTLTQISTYDDILTDALVDRAYYWTTIPKNRTPYHPSRAIKEDDITSIIQKHLIFDPNVELAEQKLLALDGLLRFSANLKTQKEKDAFRQHLQRYMLIYLPDCPFEVNTTNRYTIVTFEAAVFARRFIKKGDVVRYLSGIRVLISKEEEKAIAERKKDFSIVVSSMNKCASLFMGPARFANHDCGANAKLVISGKERIEIQATKNIDVGEEITVKYGENYFGEKNCECLCQTCEKGRVNGWAHPEGLAAVKESIEEAQAEGYSLRRRKRDGSCPSSREPSVTADLRPTVRKSRSRASLNSPSAPLPPTNDPEETPVSLWREKQKREIGLLSSPPVTPSAKRQRTLDFEAEPAPVAAPKVFSRASSMGESSGAPSRSVSDSASDTISTEVTTPDEDVKQPDAGLQFPNPPPAAMSMFTTATFKLEDPETFLLDVSQAPSPVKAQDSATGEPLPSDKLRDPVTLGTLPGSEAQNSVTADMVSGSEAQNSCTVETVSGSEAQDSVAVQLLHSSEVQDSVTVKPLQSSETHDSVTAKPFDSLQGAALPVATGALVAQGLVPGAPDTAEQTTIPQPSTPAAKATEQLPPTPCSGGLIPAAEAGPIKRGRGRPKGSGRKPKKSPSTPRNKPAQSTTQSRAAKALPIAEALPPTVLRSDKALRVRTPGDYELTEVLLATPDSAWIRCRHCNGPFVQTDAYCTKVSCPRCERHSKLYGFRWPKTEPEGKHDNEERILDHRTVHRFLPREDELRSRGRKMVGGVSVSATPDAEASNANGKRPATEDASDDAAVRRSKRRRHPSSKASELRAWDYID